MYPSLPSAICGGMWRELTEKVSALTLRGRNQITHHQTSAEDRVRGVGVVG